MGSCPDSWGVWFAHDPHQVPWARFLDELAEAGYRWLELGPYGYLPSDAAMLNDAISSRGLQVSAGTVAGALHDNSRWERDQTMALQVASLAARLGARYLVYLPEQFRDLEGQYVYPRVLAAEEWGRLLSRVSELARMVRDECGVSLVFHPHADSHVGGETEVERFLEGTDPDSVSLCLDTGHFAYCGGDSLRLIARYPDRIGYVHVKQVDPEVLAGALSEDVCFAEAVRRGVMCEPPLGIPDMGAIISSLARVKPDTFAIVEQDLYPCDPEKPLPIARRTRDYFASLGL